MTTIVGFEAKKNTDLVFLGSDQSRTRTEWKQAGDSFVKDQSKAPAQKIYVHPAGDFAVAMSGVYDSIYTNFLHYILDNSDVVRKATEKGFFEDVQGITLQRWGNTVPNPEVLNQLVFATRFDGKPALYTVFPLGKVEGRLWTSIGSGSPYALEHLANQDIHTPPHITRTRGVDLVVECLDRASQDLYTGGIDLVIATPDEIKKYGTVFRDHHVRAQREATKDIKRSLE